MASPLQLEVKTTWDEMARVHEASVAYFESAKLSRDAIDTLTMIVCELVENAIKYGQTREGDSGIVQVQVSLKKGVATVQVTNSIGKTTRTHLEDLDKTIQWVRGYQDPFEAFIERMKEISREPLSLPKSGLGIVRVAFEGRAALDFVLGEDDKLSVLAVSRVER